MLGLTKPRFEYQSWSHNKWISSHTCSTCLLDQIRKNTGEEGRGEQEASHRRRPCKKLPWSSGSSIHPLEIMQHSSPPGLKRSPDLLLKSLLCLPSFPGPFHSLFLFLGMFLPNLFDKFCISSKIYDSQNFSHRILCRAQVPLTNSDWDLPVLLFFCLSSASW